MNRSAVKIVLGTVVLIVAVLALFWQSFNNRVINLLPNSNFSYLAQDDSYALGGTSSSNIEKSNDSVFLNCQITTSSYQWPFCNITIDLKGQNSDGLDLTNFSHLRIKAKYLNSDFMGLRVQLRVFNPAYSRADKLETWKFLTTEITSSTSENIYDIPLKVLQVPNWWLSHNKIPIEYAAPEFRRTMIIELATGNNIPEGQYKLQIESIELVGKYLSESKLLYSVISILSSFIIFYLFLSIKEYKEDTKKQKMKVIELAKRNKYLASKNSNLKNKVNIDALTGTLNRHAAEKIFKDMKNGDSIIIMDIDYFKSINDNYGHDVGDDTLVLFARTISNRLRDNDYLIRWGGEEFLCICPQTSLFDCNVLANSLKDVLADQVWPIPKPLTCSFGVAEMVHGESVEMLIKRADSALYQAKHQGRNRVITSD